jgi:hypothetical protein
MKGARTMGRLIDADELVNWLKSCAPPDRRVITTMDAMLAAISSRPTVDAAPVVRCKFCEKSAVTEMGKRFCNEPLGSRGSAKVEDDDFCSRGKRREEPNEE